MKKISAKFLISNADYQKCPKPLKPEYAFIGRSNVGKSSLINMLTEQKNLAKTSQMPGKTQLINHFEVNEAWYLVDLPGYGFAKAPKNEREKWDKMIWEYLFNRTNLMCVFVLIDARHEPQKIDIEFVNKLGEKGIPIQLIFTKADKIGINVAQKNIESFHQILLQTWEETPPHILTSSERKTGREELLKEIERLNKVFKLP
jgi:GTP-binding protein